MEMVLEKVVNFDKLWEITQLADKNLAIFLKPIARDHGSIYQTGHSLPSGSHGPGYPFLGESHSLSEPRLMMQVAGKSITFFLDMGATYSVLTSHSGLMFTSPVSVMGVDRTHSFPLQTLLLPYILAG